MGGVAHSHLLFVHGNSRIHRLKPQCKVAATVLFVLTVVATPREAFWAFGAHALVLAAVARTARVPLGFVARRLTIELPFVAFALFLPLVAGGPRVEVAGASLSVDGLWAAWNILAKSTLGVAASIILAASTPVPEILKGLDRLRLPKAFTAVAGFMVRYLDVVTDQMRRMRIARASRGYDPRWAWQVKALAWSAGTLFIRSYERGERVYLAMVSRGFTGALPVLGEQEAGRGQWAATLTVPALSALVAAAAWLTLP
ncbi:MAG: cobalt ECF transporter T component CbiQ [Actinomycetota bacterium]